MTANFNQLFTKLENWQFQQFNPQEALNNITARAYVIEFKKIPQTKELNLEEFHTLLQAPQIERLQALVCQINYERNKPFGVVLEALCDASEEIPNLKALFIGDGEQHEYRKSKIDVFDIRPILEAYPNLQVLQIRGCFCEYELECKSLRHEHLKTLIVETADLDARNLAQICALELPALEYLELWLGRRLWDAKSTIDTLMPILFGESLPNLSYLGLRSSENADLIAEALVQSPILESLTALDLSMGNLSNSGAATLLNCPAIDKLYTLNIANNLVSEGMVQRLLQLNCQVIADNQEEDCEGGYGYSRYSALHE